MKSLRPQSFHLSKAHLTPANLILSALAMVLVGIVVVNSMAAAAPLVGPDTSHYQTIMDAKRAYAQGYRYHIAKATQGTGFKDSKFATSRANAAAAGLIPGAYHFLNGGSGAAQADFFVNRMKATGGTKGIMMMLDVEASASGNPTYADVVAFSNRFKQLVPGRTLIIYTGRWYWGSRAQRGYLGNPKAPAGTVLAISIYSNCTGTAFTILKCVTPQGAAGEPYVADPLNGWSKYYFRQFTDKAIVANVSPVDANVTYESLTSLKALAGLTAPPPTPKPTPKPTPTPTPKPTPKPTPTPPTSYCCPQVQGAIYTKWQALGGINGVLGKPTTAEQTVAGGKFNLFTGGAIYWSTATGARMLRTQYLAKYTAVGGPAGILGFPTSDPLPSAPGGEYATFQKGNIYIGPAVGAHVVKGSILTKYLALKGSLGVAGFPTSDEATVAGGYISNFQFGTITSSVAGLHFVHGAVATKYAALKGPAGVLGFPTSDELVATPGGFSSNFQRGSILYSAPTGAHYLTSAIDAKYTALKRQSGFLGFPVTDEAVAAPGGLKATFQHGQIFWSTSSGSHFVRGAIQTKYTELGASAGVLGFPISDETATATGVQSIFQHGRIDQNTKTGVVTVTTGNPTPTPSPSPTTSPTPTLTAGDVNGDRRVNAIDLSLLLSAWGTNKAGTDINKDGTVGAVDLSILLRNWTG